MDPGPPWPTNPWGTPPPTLSGSFQCCGHHYCVCPCPGPGHTAYLSPPPAYGRQDDMTNFQSFHGPAGPPHVQVLHGEDKYVYIETPAFDVNTGSSSMAKKFFNRRPKGPFDRTTFAVREDVTVESLINRMGGKADRGDYLLEALEQGYGVFLPGQVLTGNGNLKGKKLFEVGFSSNRGTKNSPVWLVLITKKD